MSVHSPGLVLFQLHRVLAAAEGPSGFIEAHGIFLVAAFELSDAAWDLIPRPRIEPGLLTGRTVLATDHEVPAEVFKSSKLWLMWSSDCVCISNMHLGS